MWWICQESGENEKNKDPFHCRRDEKNPPAISLCTCCVTKVWASTSSIFFMITFIRLKLSVKNRKGKNVGDVSCQYTCCVTRWTCLQICFCPIKLFLFHLADVYDNTWQRLEPLGIDTECLGGGRILHEPDKKHIRVYGYSQVQTIA